VKNNAAFANFIDISPCFTSTLTIGGPVVSSYTTIGFTIDETG